MAYRSAAHARVLLLSAAALLAVAAEAAHAADQFKQAADGAGIECIVSARELTRFALVDDQFASVSKISTGTPYNDFAVTNEPVRGDIYVSVPETYAARSISFFTTTKKGFVYKVACRVEQIPATQVFITNPAIAKNRAADWESQTPIETSAVRLIQAMANDRTVDGFEVRQSTAIYERNGHRRLAGTLRALAAGQRNRGAIHGDLQRRLHRQPRNADLPCDFDRAGRAASGLRLLLRWRQRGRPGFGL